MANLGEKISKFAKAPIKETFKFMGENPNGAIIVAASIALFKGIFRPIFTLADKKSDPQTKKYTAIREALTELIALPVYIAVPTIGGKLVVNKFYKNATAVTKKAAEANVKFLAVLASTAIIPAICNLVQPPIMDSIKRKGEAKKALSENKIAAPQSVDKPSFKGLNPIPRRTYGNNYGMRVGS